MPYKFKNKKNLFEQNNRKNTIMFLIKKKIKSTMYLKSSPYSREIYNYTQNNYFQWVSKSFEFFNMNFIIACGVETITYNYMIASARPKLPLRLNSAKKNTFDQTFGFGRSR